MKYVFDKKLKVSQIVSITLQLRKDGFSAVAEYDREEKTNYLNTDATQAQIALSSGLGLAVKPVLLNVPETFRTLGNTFADFAPVGKIKVKHTRNLKKA